MLTCNQHTQYGLSLIAEGEGDAIWQESFMWVPEKERLGVVSDRITMVEHDYIGQAALQRALHKRKKNTEKVVLERVSEELAVVQKSRSTLCCVPKIKCFDKRFKELTN